MHIAQTRITDNGYLVFGFIGVEFGIGFCVRHRSTLVFLCISVIFDIGQQFEREIEHIRFRPHDFCIGFARRIDAFGRQFQRNFVLVIVVLVIAAQANEHRQFVVVQFAHIVEHVFGVGKHLQPPILAHIQRNVFIDGARIAGCQIVHTHNHRLFVFLRQLRLAGVGFARYAGRQHIVHRRFFIVLFDAHRRHVHGTDSRRRIGRVVQRFGVTAPFATNQFECTETQKCRFGKSVHKHTHEAYRFEIANRADFLFVLANRNFELIPSNIFGFAVFEFDMRHNLIGDKIVAHFHGCRPQTDTILIVFFVLVQRIILIDILDIGHRGSRHGIGFGAGIGCRRIAFGAAIVFVAFDDTDLGRIVIGATIMMEIVAGGVVQWRERIVLKSGQRRGCQCVAQSFDIVFVGWKCKFVVGAQAVQAHILIFAGTGAVVERQHHRLFARHTSPHGGIGLCGIAIDGHAVFEKLFTIFQNILRHIAQVEIQIAALSRAQRIVHKRVHQPKLQVLDVGRFEIAGFQLAHHAAPTFFGILQFARGHIHAGDIHIVRTTFVGIETQVQHRQIRRLPHQTFAIWEQLLLAHGTRQVIRLQIRILANMLRRGGIVQVKYAIID